MKIDWGKRDPEEGRAQLARWLGQQPGVSDATVSSWRVPGAGSSYETVFCDARWTQDGRVREEELVVRVQLDYSLFHDADLFLQADVMRGMARHPGVPVPDIYWAERSAQPLGAPFFVMSKVEGQIPPDLIAYRKGNFVDSLTPAERSRLYEAGLGAMAAIHLVDWRQGFTFLDGKVPGTTGLDQYLSWVEQWHEWAANGRRLDVIEAGLRYLRDSQPDDPGIGVVWGDARAGNMIFGSDLRPAAVIDWEMAALGPAEVDLGWWVMWETIWLPEGARPEEEGFLTHDQMVAAYERHLGRSVRNFDYYLLLAGVRFAIMMTVGVDKRIEAGILPPGTTAGTHNVATRFVSRLLGLPLPELSPDLGQLASEMGDS